MKYGLAVGNHDGGPGNTANFNSYFPASRVGDGHYGSDNDNHYGLFSSGGLDFIIIHLENNDSPDTNVLAWADNLLATRLPQPARHRRPPQPGGIHHRPEHQR